MSCRLHARTKLNLAICKPLLFAATTCTLAFYAGSLSAQTNTNWIGGGSGIWNSVGNWSGGFVPNNGNGGTNWNVFIDNGDAGNSTVNMDLTSTINQLNIDAGDGLNILNNRTLSISNTGQAGAGILNNDGTLNINSIGNTTFLSFLGTTAINGSGTINFNGASNTAFISGSGTLTHGANHTIQGSGNLGNNLLSINNLGTVQAGSGQSLLIDPSNIGTENASFNNSGLVRAFDGGIVVLTGNGAGEFGGSGTYQAEADSRIDLISGIIARNTTFATSGSGEIRLQNSNTASFDGVTLNGNLVLRNNSTMTIATSLTNTGDILIDSIGNVTTLSNSGTTTLDGGGTVRLAGGNVARIAGSGFLTNVDNTISGNGMIGNNLLRIVNQGTFQAGAGEVLTIDPANLGGGNIAFDNQNLVRAFDGGVVVLDGNAGGEFGGIGTYQAEAGSRIDLVSGIIARNTTFATSGSGEIRLQNSNAGTFDDVTLNGNMVLRNNSTMTIATSLTNSGDILIDSIGNATTLSNSGTTTLDGGGTVRLAGGNVARLAGSGFLTNVDNTISGSGMIGNNSLSIVNQGTFQAGASEVLTIDPANLGGGNIAFDNQNLVRAFDGGVVVLTGNAGGEFGGSGTYRAEGGSRIDLVSGLIARNTTFATSGSGEIRLQNSSTGTFDGVTLNGNMVLNNNTSLFLQNSLTNSGDILLTTVGNVTSISNSGTTTLDGGGTIRLTSTNLTRITGTGTLTNVDNIISGNGNVGNNVLEIINQGTILSGTGENLVIDPRNAGAGVATFDNTGTVRAAGGTLTLTGSGGGEFKGGGVYEALNGGNLLFDGSAITQSISAGTLVEGTWRAIDGGAGANVRVQNNTTSLINTIGATAAIELSGANSNFTVRAANISIDSTLDTIAGSLILRDGRTMNLTGGLANAGNMILDGALTSLTVNGDYTQSGGSLGLFDGATVNLTGAMNDFTGGLVFGNGTINGNVSNTSATFAPGLSPGELEIVGSYVQAGGGSLLIEVGGLNQGISYDHLLVGGSATLDGNLVVSLWNGFVPDSTDLFVILSANSLSGVFSNASTTVNVVGGGFFEVTYSNNSVTLGNFNPIPEPSCVGMLLIGSVCALARRRQRRNVS